MGEIIKFPEKKKPELQFNKAECEPKSVSPEVLFQMVAPDEWERAVIILQRSDETLTICSDPSLPLNHMLVDMAKLSLFLKQIPSP